LRIFLKNRAYTGRGKKRTMAPEINTEQLIAEIKSTYHNNLQAFKSSEPRPSLLWRGDSIVLGTHAFRWAFRVRLRERDTDIGFVNVRPHQSLGESSLMPVTAEAFLAPPAKMLLPIYEFYLASDFHHLYGEQIQEKNTCYVIPYESSGGVCAHACMYMCSVMLSRFGVRTLTTHEICFVNALCKNNIKFQSARSQPFEVTGINAVDMQTILRSTFMKSSAFLELRPQPQASSSLFKIHKDLNVFTIQQYLRQGLPVIAIVDFDRLYPSNVAADEPQKDEAEEKVHAVVLVGTRNASPYNLPERFVYHDPYPEKGGPYREKSVTAFIGASTFLDKIVGKKEDKKTYVQKCKMAFLALLPPSVTAGVSSVLQSFFILSQPSLHPFKTNQTYSLPQYINLQLCLLPRKQLGTKYSFLRLSTPVHRAFSRHFRALPRWVWVVELYATQDRMKNREASAVFFFDSQLPKSSPKARPRKNPKLLRLLAVCMHEKFIFWPRRGQIQSIEVRGRIHVESERNGI
jgi:hypothetical protein